LKIAFKDFGSVDRVKDEDEKLDFEILVS